MLINLLAGASVMVICLLLQAVFVTVCLRRYSRFRWTRPEAHTRLESITLLAMVMLLMQVGAIVQVAIWATLFLIAGEFGDFPTAMYHSGVNFTGLGYGDIVMSERRRLLGPLETANGILMFGVSTAVLTAAVLDIIKHHAGQAK